MQLKQTVVNLEKIKKKKQPNNTTYSRIVPSQNKSRSSHPLLFIHKSR